MDRFSGFGCNKQQEISRLLFEIAKREHLKEAVVASEIPDGCRNYASVKDHLLKRRFPDAVARGLKISEVFPACEIDPVCAVELDRPQRVPVFERVFIEEGLEGTRLSRRVQKKFPDARIVPVKSYREHCSHNRFDISSYNFRTQELFIVREAYEGVKPCPCSPGVVPCGYHNIDLGFGCPFECSYCFLQNYTNAPGIVLPANIDDFFEAFRRAPSAVRVGSGETTDSLVYDDLTGFASEIVDFFRNYPDAVFEFKTKSDHVAGLLGVKASSNIVVGWSLNPQDLIDGQEYFTASLAARLEAARRCALHGYRIAFHFDPVIHTPEWEALYAALVGEVFKYVPAESVAWISIGTLRMTPGQKKIIENRFPKNTILDAELFTAEDGKLRYAHYVRLDIYRNMISWINERKHPSTRVYLCMETPSMWKDAGITCQWRV